MISILTSTEKINNEVLKLVNTEMYLTDGERENRDTEKHCGLWFSYLSLFFLHCIEKTAYRDTDTPTLTSDNEVCIWEKAFSLHECSGVTRVENIKDAICIDPHWSVS